MRVLITGHTGFKGSWMTLLLNRLGHEVGGFALPPREGVLYKEAGASNLLSFERIGDIRDLNALKEAASSWDPEIVIHMAAQPLVLDSYGDPIGTYETNVVGTMNVLNVFATSASVRAMLSVTTDKVYFDDGVASYKESAKLGGKDPYSNSKALADLFSQEFALRARSSGKAILVARAGNVIGSWDGSANRLMPDVIRSLRSGTPISIRNPLHVRPWQHVLDCIGGYWSFITRYLQQPSTPAVLNFGPAHGEYKSVQDILDLVAMYRPDLQVRYEVANQLETPFLTLDSESARKALGWVDQFSTSESVRMTLEEVESTSVLETALQQVDEYLQRSALQKLS